MCVFVEHRRKSEGPALKALVTNARLLTKKGCRCRRRPQVILYQYAISRSFSQYQGTAFDGQVANPDHVIDIPAAAVNAEFINKMGKMMRRLSAEASARRVPSRAECAFCDITSADCPERFVDESQGQGVTDDL